MFSIDERFRGLPAGRDQVVSLHQSLNQPHLAIPGKKAGPAQAFILGIRGASGFAVFIYLYLAESQDCAVYVSENRNVSGEQYASEEAEAQGFVESMGFMMDNLNFRALPQDRQEELLKNLPVFQKDPRLVAGPKGAKDAKPAPGATLARLFSAF